MRVLIPSTTSDFFSEFDRVVESFLSSNRTVAANSLRTGEFRETDNHYLVTFDIPGVKKEDMHIELKENLLTVSGERFSSLEGKRSFGKFSRSLIVPSSVDGEKIEAHYEDGVLEVLLPKVAAPLAKKVEIQSGKSGFFSRMLGGGEKVDKREKAAESCRSC